MGVIKGDTRSLDSSSYHMVQGLGFGASVLVFRVLVAVSYE